MRKAKKQVSDFIDGMLKTKVDVILPHNLSKTDFLKHKPAHYDDTEWIDGCRWVVHSIKELDFIKKYKGSSEFSPLYSIILKKILGNNYRDFINGLIDAQIIETDEEYSATGHQCFGFKLSEKYDSSPIKYVTLTSKTLKNAILNYRKERIKKLKQKALPLAHLVRWLSEPSNLTIDKVAALEFLESYKRKLQTELSKRKLKPKYKKIQQGFIDKRYYKIKFQIENWDISAQLSIDDSGGRVYSSLTGLPSIFRNFLQFKGEKLVSLDLKNSQPFNFLFLLKKEFWKSYTSGITLKRLNKELYDYITNKQRNNITIPNIMFPKTPETQYSKGLQDANFLNLVTEGKLYEFICHHFYGHFTTTSGIDRFSTRNLTKKQVLKLMYSNPKRYNPEVKAIFKKFKETFPIEGGIMEILKQRKHNDLSVLLQTIEAQMLLHRIGKRIFLHNPNIPLYSIHDSLVTTEQYAPVVKQIMEDEYNNHLGLTPTIKLEEYSEDNASKELSKYVKGKVTEADIEISQSVSVLPKGFGFLKCEHYDYYKTKKEALPPVFDLVNYTIPEALKDVSVLGVNKRKLKK